MNHSSYINHEVVFRLTQYIVPVAFGVIMAVGLVGNVLVISVVSVMTGVTRVTRHVVQVYRTPQMKNTTNLLILNLAVADLLFLLVCVPATASDYVLMYWPFGLAWCRCVRSDQRNYADKF